MFSNSPMCTEHGKPWVYCNIHTYIQLIPLQSVENSPTWYFFLDLDYNVEIFSVYSTLLYPPCQVKDRKQVLTNTPREVIQGCSFLWCNVVYDVIGKRIAACNWCYPPEWHPHIIAEVWFTLPETCSSQVIFSGIGYSMPNTHAYIREDAHTHLGLILNRVCLGFGKLQTPAKDSLKAESNHSQSL